MAEDKDAGMSKGKMGGIGSLAAKFGRLLPMRKAEVCTGISIRPESLTAVLLVDRGNEFRVSNLAIIERQEGESLSGLKSAIRSLNKKWKLASTEIHISLSSDQVVYKFLVLPGLSNKQMEQAIHAQLKTDKTWDPKKHYLAFAPVRAIRNQTRVFASYVEQELVKHILSGFSAIGAKVYSVEPEIASFHRALLFSKMLEDRTLALVEVMATGGQLTIFTKEGVMLSRGIGGKRQLATEEEKPEEEADVSGVESFDVDIAVSEIKKTFNYYEYSLTAGEVDVGVFTGEPILLEALSRQVGDALGIETENFVIDIGLDGEVASTFDPLTHGTGLGVALGGVK